MGEVDRIVGKRHLGVVGQHVQPRRFAGDVEQFAGDAHQLPHETDVLRVGTGGAADHKHTAEPAAGQRGAQRCIFVRPGHRRALRASGRQGIGQIARHGTESAYYQPLSGVGGGRGQLALLPLDAQQAFT